MDTNDVPQVSDNLIESKYAYLGVLASALCFQIINQIVTVYGPPKSVQIGEWKYKNLFISWIHALIVGTWDASWYV